MNFWDYITSKSTLPVQPGNTFKDHLNNLDTGNGGAGGILPVFYQQLVFEQLEPSEIVIDASINQVTISELSVAEITIDEDEINIGDY